jgi:acyl-CoA thioester hydrolase
VTEREAEPARVLVFEIDIPIRWGDMDAMGHVNNTVYFRYLEQARISWFDAMGFSPDPGGEGPVIVNAHCSFIRELRYPGTVRCRLYTGAIGRSSFETFAVLSRTDDPDTVYAEGGAKVVWVDHPKRKSAPLPEQARKAIASPVPAQFPVS